MQRFSLTAKNSSGHQVLYIDLDHEDLDDGVALTLAGEYEGEQIQIDFNPIDRTLFDCILKALTKKMDVTDELWPEKTDPEYVRSMRNIPEPHRARMIQGDPTGFQKVDPDVIILREQRETRNAIRSLLELMEANYADPGFSVYDRGNNLIASISPEQQQRVEEIIRYLLDEGLTLLQRNNLNDVAKYQELIGAVKGKHPGETRHETALRYIREAEAPFNGGLEDADAET